MAPAIGSDVPPGAFINAYAWSARVPLERAPRQRNQFHPDCASWRGRRPQWGPQDRGSAPHPPRAAPV